MGDQNREYQILFTMDVSGVIESQKRASEALAKFDAEMKAYSEQSAEQVKKGAVTYNKAMVDHALADSKAFASKSQLKTAIKELGHEFPILGQVGRLAMNPIALAAAAITGAFVIWRKRVNDLVEAMTTAKLSDVELLKTKRVQAAKEQWDQYAESLKVVQDRLNGLAAKHEETMKRIEAFFGLVNKLQPEADTAPAESKAKVSELHASAANARISRENRLRRAGWLTDYLQKGFGSLSPENIENRKTKDAEDIKAQEEHIKELERQSNQERPWWASQYGPLAPWGAKIDGDREQARNSLPDARLQLAGMQGRQKSFEKVLELKARIEKEIADLTSGANSDLENSTLWTRQAGDMQQGLDVQRTVDMLHGRRPVSSQPLPVKASVYLPGIPIPVTVPTGIQPGTGFVTLNTGEKIGVTPDGRGNSLQTAMLPYFVKALEAGDAVLKAQQARAKNQP